MDLPPGSTDAGEISAVALTGDDARRLGFDPAGLNYGYAVQTANGEARAARVTLPSIAIAGVRVDNVDAFVIDHGLETSLLGMTYLGRLSRIEATPTALILRPYSTLIFVGTDKNLNRARQL